MAVLPFADFSPDKDQDYFCEGMAEEIINLLVKIDGLRVASRTSAFQIKEPVTDIKEIGEKLNVEPCWAAACARPATGCASPPS